MKKITLSVVFALGVITTITGSTGFDSTEKSDFNSIEQIESDPLNDCFYLASDVFFYLTGEGMTEDEAHDAATAIETVCNLLT